MDEIEGSQTDFSSVMTEFRTNRKTRKRFPIVGKVISREPSIVSFEDAGSIYVEDGSGQRYVVKYSDGHTAEVEFSDAFDAESSEVSEEEVGQAEDNEDRDVKQVYTERGRVDDAELMEVLVASLIPESDAVGKLRANLEVLESDPGTQTVLAGIIRDEQRHVAYLSGWMERFERRFSPRAVAATRERLEEVFRQLDVTYYAGLQEYFERAAA